MRTNIVIDDEIMTEALLAADNYRKLHQHGVTVRKTIDALIATFCIEQKCSLLFRDRDFLPFVKHLGLVRAH